MQVRLLQSMAGVGRSWMVGEIYECESAEEAGRLIEAGIAEAVNARVETATAPDAAPRQDAQVETATPPERKARK